jgi:4,5-dihydroxyphthalate decarboxylase
MLSAMVEIASGPRIKLETLLARYPNTAALRDGKLESGLIDFAFDDLKAANLGFKPFVRSLRYDAGELAIVAFLQAKAAGKPLVLMPATIMGRFQHDTIAYNATHGPLKPGDLAGKRIGVRAYTQTTGVWVRGILEEEYGVDLDRVTTVSFEDAHVAEYVDPPHVERAAPGKTLEGMLLAGEVDAAIFGPHLPKQPGFRHLIPDLAASVEAWHRKHAIVPVNHLMVVKSALSLHRPDVVRELYRLLVAAKHAAGPPGPIDMQPFGVTALRRSLETIVDYSWRQKLIPHRILVDELFDDHTRALGA